MVIKMNLYNDKEIIESIDLAITLLKNKKVLFSNHLGNKTFFIEKRKRILVMASNSTYYLSYDQFKELFNEASFIEYEDNDATIDYQRDDEYYSWKHK